MAKKTFFGSAGPENASTQRLAFDGGGTQKGASHIAKKQKTPASPGQRQNARPYL